MQVSIVMSKQNKGMASFPTVSGRLVSGDRSIIADFTWSSMDEMVHDIEKLMS